MNRKGSDFAGLSVALVTPFRDGKLDKPALKEQIEFQLEAGTHCLVPVGTTGESPTLSHPEHEEIIIETLSGNDNRSYHINSDKIFKSLGFKAKRSLEEAVRDLCLSFKQGLIKRSFENDLYYNVRRLKSIRAK